MISEELSRAIILKATEMSLKLDINNNYLTSTHSLDRPAFESFTCYTGAASSYFIIDDSIMFFTIDEIFMDKEDLHGEIIKVGARISFKSKKSVCGKEIEFHELSLEPGRKIDPIGMTMKIISIASALGKALFNEKENQRFQEAIDWYLDSLDRKFHETPREITKEDMRNRCHDFLLKDFITFVSSIMETEDEVEVISKISI